MKLGTLREDYFGAFKPEWSRFCPNLVSSNFTVRAWEARLLHSEIEESPRGPCHYPARTPVSQFPDERSFANLPELCSIVTKCFHRLGHRCALPCQSC